MQNKRIQSFRDHQYLEIRHVNEQDAGVYTCIAENLAGRAKQNLELQVLGNFLYFNLILSER